MLPTTDYNKKYIVYLNGQPVYDSNRIDHVQNYVRKRRKLKLKDDIHVMFRFSPGNYKELRPSIYGK